MGLFWLFLVGCFEPVLAHHGLVLAHLGTVFALFGPAVGCLDSSWACLRHRWQPGWDALGGGGEGGAAFFSAFGGQNGAQNRVILVSFRGPILVMIFSSLRNDFYGSRVPFWGVIFVIFLHVLTPNIL